jgi:hypothetical protein
MISHMTSEGIGLRHLCDWAVCEDIVNIIFRAQSKHPEQWQYHKFIEQDTHK